MQTTSASMVWLFLRENVLPQWQQKIALRAENKPVQSLITTSTLIIFCVSNFLSPLRRQFSGLRDGLLKPNVSNPFSPSLYYIYKPNILYCTLFFSLSKMNITPEVTLWVL